MPEMIIDSRTLFFILSKDKKVLIHAISNIDRHPENELQQMYESARRTIVRSFSNEVVIKRLAELYESSLSEIS